MSLDDDADILELNLRTYTLEKNAGDRNYWKKNTLNKLFTCTETALLLCDVWDNHWSRAAFERLEAMVPRMNEVVNSLRSRGVQIIHAPAGVLASYVKTEAYKKVSEVSGAEPEKVVELDLPPRSWAIDSSELHLNSDTSEPKSFCCWTEQHPGIKIDYDKDVISSSGNKIYNFMNSAGLKNMLIMGVHGCIMDRTFGIINMVSWGVKTVLIRDLTDNLYNPALWPYVNQDEGTKLMVNYIEKFLCPSVKSNELTRGY